MEFFHTVKVQTKHDGEISRKLRAIARIAAEPIEIAEPSDGGDKPADPLPPAAPPAPVPYFDIGDATGSPGETVEVPVQAGCLHPMTGFDIGGGVGLRGDARSGYGKFRAVGAKLGPFLTRYLKVQDAHLHDKPDEVGQHYFSRFEFADWDQHEALPEEWWRFMVGLFSLEHKVTLDPIPIPIGTHLFTLMIEILSKTPPGEYELTCKDEWYYRQELQRRLDFTWTYSPQGFTKIETFPGKITVR